MKVGDRVRCIATDGCQDWFKSGSEGTVRAILTGALVDVMFDMGPYKPNCEEGGLWCAHVAQLEAIDA